MTAGAGARAWANDYGDVPRWYWLPRHALVRRANVDSNRWRRGPLLWALMLGALSP